MSGITRTIVLLICLWGVPVKGIAQGDLSGTNTATKVGFEYVYDVARDETPTVTVNAGGDAVVQPVFVPESMTRLSGVRLKAERTGRPGDLVVEVLRASTGQVIGAGRRA